MASTGTSVVRPFLPCAEMKVRVRVCMCVCVERLNWITMNWNEIKAREKALYPPLHQQPPEKKTELMGSPGGTPQSNPFDLHVLFPSTPSTYMTSPLEKGTKGERPSVWACPLCFLLQQLKRQQLSSGLKTCIKAPHHIT